MHGIVFGGFGVYSAEERVNSYDKNTSELYYVFELSLLKSGLISDIKKKTK